MKKRVIAFDVMGNDNGVKPCVEAALSFLNANKGFEIILVGNEKEINKYTQEKPGLKIIHTSEVVNKTMGARAARGGNTSMALAVNLVKDKKADVVISSGDSAIYLTITTLSLKRMPGVSRPAFMPIFPTTTKGKNFVMMDVGANLDVTGEMLYEWSQMGNIFAKKVLNIKKPKVGLINIGTEENKGKSFHTEANELLKKDKNINYVGFVETRELLSGSVDVAVVDGYGGNLVLKTMEGTSLALLSLIKKTLLSKFTYKIGALLSKGGFKEVKNTLDYKNVGGA